MGFGILDALIVVVYLVGVAVFGVAMAGRQHSARDYFLSEKAIPWWAVCLTIVATETSAITFLSLPGIAYAANLEFLQLGLGYIAGRVLISVLFIPRYMQGELSTAYAFLGERFSPGVRRAASAVFMGTRTFADGVRLFTTAIPLALLLEGSRFLPSGGAQGLYLPAIVLLTAITLVYVYLGGIRAVVWTDVAQWFIYMIGAAAAIYFLLRGIDAPLSSVLGDALRAGKLDVFRWGADGGWGAFFAEKYTFAASVLGGAFLSMASHGTDQIIVQRILATQETRAAQKAMIASGLVVFVQMALFLLIGVLLHRFYGGAPHPGNEVFASYIVRELPSGVSGLIVAGLLAAAMSTLSGSISALASTTLLDFIAPLRGLVPGSAASLRLSRLVSLLWAGVLMVVATLFIGTPNAVIELALGIASYVYGPLLGLFLLGVRRDAGRPRDAMLGFFGGIAVMTAVVTLTTVAWTWYTLIGCAVTMAIARGAALIPARPRPEA